MFLRQAAGIKLQLIICVCLYVGPILGGYGGSWVGPIIPKLRDLDQSPLPYLLTETQLALVGSFGYLGAIPGPYIMTWLSNTKGRKPCLIASSVIGILSFILLATAKNFGMLLLGRFLFAVSSGTNNVVNFVYIGEIASPHVRGILLSIMGAMFTVGSILIFSTGPYVSYLGSTYIGIALTILHLAALSWIPESPIFFAIQGKDNEVLKILNDLGRSEEVTKMMEMRKELSQTSTKKDWMELFTVKSNRKALYIVIVINCLQHGSGIMAILLFSASIFEMAGSSVDGNIALIIIMCCQLMGSTMTPFLIESTGRKKILIISSSICCFSMFIFGLYFYLDHIHSPIVEYIKWLPLVILIVFYVGYDFGLGIIPNAIIGEMFTTNVRSKGSTLAMTSSWLVGFIVSTAFGSLLTVVGGHVAFWFFSCVCACAVLFTVFFVPETKGKTLSEIQEALSYSTNKGSSRAIKIVADGSLFKIVYLGQTLCGYTISWSGPVIPKLRDLEQSPLPYLLSESQLSLVATMIYLGGMLGPYITIWLSNTRGRKPCLICGGVMFAVTNIILASSRSLAMLLIGRFVAGIALGTTMVMNLVYIGEIASTNVRGILLTATGIFTTVGSTVNFGYGPFVSYHATTYLPLMVSLVFIFCLFWIPEPPIFCMLQGKDDEVVKVLTYLDRLEDKDELLQSKKDLSETSTKKEWKELFVEKNNRRALFIVAVINILQHCSGVLAVVFFAASIFDMAGSSINSNLSMIIIGFFKLAGSSVTPIFIERIGRKRILTMSSALCSLSMFVLGLYFYLDHIGNPYVDNIKWLPLVILILFYIGYDSGLGIIPNAIIGEMFTSNVRSKGSTVAMTTSWVFGFAVNTVFGALLETVGGHFLFWFFSFTCACAVLFTMFFIPETRGKSLLEIQESLS